MDKKNLRRIEEVVDDTFSLENISLVTEPAIEVDFFYFNKEVLKFAIEDDEKRIVTGPAMIPDMDILRRDEEGYYMIWFSKESVRKAAELFFKKSNVNRSNLEHEFSVDGVTTFESWIVDKENGKSGGKNYEDIPDGTWMVSMKIDNDEVWESFIKTGIIKGFSVEIGKYNNSKTTLNDLSDSELLELYTILSVKS